MERKRIKRLTGLKHDIGFPVVRLLPAAGQRFVGPFVFLDHMGPARFGNGDTQGDVRPHPHIGLATLTYLFDGAMMHRDSLGSVQRIEPGELNWMSAGTGIVHSERIPEDIRSNGKTVEGLQLWMALPLEEEHSAPHFRHVKADAMPVIATDGMELKLVAGRGFGCAAAIPQHGNMLLADLRLCMDQTFEWNAELPERAVYCVEGSLRIGDERLEAGEMVVLPDDGSITLTAALTSRAILLGGEPLDGPRHLWWNFVASDPAALPRAREAWQKGEFVAIPGESERIDAPVFVHRD